MPVNPHAFEAPDPEPDPQDQAQEDQTSAEAPKRKRRTRAELIAEATVPGFDEIITVKDKQTGAKIERHWRVAVELFREDKIEWPSNDLKYAFMKYEQERAAKAEAGQIDEPTVPVEQAEDKLATEQSGMLVAPPEAAVGDEVVIGSTTYVVGHGNNLVQGMVSDKETGDPIIPKRRWQRTLGTGANGTWESRPLSQQDAPAVAPEDPKPTDQNGHRATVETVQLPETVEDVYPGVVKISTGTLDKIGLPNYSSLQIGPITATRLVKDDGRRTTTTVKGREVSVITAAVEAFEELNNTVEFIGDRFRGQLMTYLESAGAVSQPTS
jgi:hypothetical protein